MALGLAMFTRLLDPGFPKGLASAYLVDLGRTRGFRTLLSAPVVLSTPHGRATTFMKHGKTAAFLEEFLFK